MGRGDNLCGIPFTKFTNGIGSGDERGGQTCKMQVFLCKSDTLLSYIQA